MSSNASVIIDPITWLFAKGADITFINNVSKVLQGDFSPVSMHNKLDTIISGYLSSLITDNNVIPFAIESLILEFIKYIEFKFIDRWVSWTRYSYNEFKNNQNNTVKFENPKSEINLTNIGQKDFILTILGDFAGCIKSNLNGCNVILNVMGVFSGQVICSNDANIFIKCQNYVQQLNQKIAIGGYQQVTSMHDGYDRNLYGNIMIISDSDIYFNFTDATSQKIMIGKSKEG